MPDLEAHGALTAKEKKAKRSEERYKKGKKRQRDVTEESSGLASAAVIEQNYPEIRQDRDSKVLTKKRKASEDTEQTSEETTKPDTKKRRRKAPNATAEDNTATEGQGDGQPSKHRYIVFIGNLPYTTTLPALEKHFASITPASIRHRTDPATQKSKGFAFLEFASYDRMKTCLKLYHHSLFDSGVPGERNQRRINVELTAGGGGKGEARKGRVKEKNERLEGERKRRAEAAAKDETRKAKKGGAKGKVAGNETGTEDGNAGMHPSRLARIRAGK